MTYNKNAPVRVSGIAEYRHDYKFRHTECESAGGECEKTFIHSAVPYFCVQSYSLIMKCRFPETSKKLFAKVEYDV